MKKIYVFLAALGISAAAQAQTCDCMVELDSTFTIVPMNGGTAPEYRNDDMSSAAIAIPFTFNLYGQNFDTLFINNNGNVSFLNSYFTYTASGFPVAEFPMVASFWGDVDTRDSISGLVYYKITDHALIVRYDHVGYFPSSADLLNDFQLVISDGQSPLIPEGHNIAFCYGDMQWTTGSASGGTGGFGGSPANVGANAGDGISSMQIGLFNQEGNVYDGPQDNPDGIDYLDYSNIYFSTNGIDDNQAPIDVTNYCDTILGNPGDSLGFFFFDAIDQDLVYELTEGGGGYLSIGNGPGGMTVYNGEIQALRNDGDRDINSHSFILYVSPNTPDGVYPFAVTATDNGVPALSVVSHYVLVIGQGAPTSVTEVSTDRSVYAYLNNGKIMFNGVDANKVQNVTLYDNNGRSVFSSNKMVNFIEADHLSEGIYLYSIRYANRTFTGKVVKN